MTEINDAILARLAEATNALADASFILAAAVNDQAETINRLPPNEALQSSNHRVTEALREGSAAQSALVTVVLEISAAQKSQRW